MEEILWKRALAVRSAVLLALTLGCGDESAARRETSFVGALAGPTEVGRLALVFAADLADLEVKQQNAVTA